MDESEKALKASLVLTLVMETLKATLFLLLLLHYCVSDIVTPQSAVCTLKDLHVTSRREKKPLCMKQNPIKILDNNRQQLRVVL